MSTYLRTTSIDSGLFSSECEVALQIDGRNIRMMVDRSDVNGDLLRVSVVSQNQDIALVEFPCEMYSGFSRVFVPSSLVVVQ